jgi:hypothetical protein
LPLIRAGLPRRDPAGSRKGDELADDRLPTGNRECQPEDAALKSIAAIMGIERGELGLADTTLPSQSRCDRRRLVGCQHRVKLI